MTCILVPIVDSIFKSPSDFTILADVFKKIAAFLPKSETTISVPVESLLDLGEAEQSRKVMKLYPMSCFDFRYSSCPFKIEL